jgi:SPP1 family predicted phage head-tail adaptor
MVKAGTYDQSLTFRSIQNISDGYGGTIPSFVDLIFTYGSVKVLKAFNTVEATQLELPQTYEIRIMYRASFTPTEHQRILYKGKDLQIKSVRRDGERYKMQYVITATAI